MNAEFTPVTPHDVPQLEALIRRSARGLSGDDYSPAQIEACVAHVFGVDSELVADGTYYAAWQDSQPIACGGWSRRRTLFGGDNFAERESGYLDPAVDAAKIRAFFVDPGFARRGLGAALLRHCEDRARDAGFRRAEMMATLPGVRLYRAMGYEGDQVEIFTTPDGTAVPFVPMWRGLD